LPPVTLPACPLSEVSVVAPDLPPLQADPVRFKQILFNLLSNAVKFTPESGTITVTARKVDQSTGQGVDSSRPVDRLTSRPIDTNGEWLEIAVTDTGVGIRAEDLPRLFQEFVQLETIRDTRQEGTGLGLALTKQLVELHGGRIWAESEGKDKGSTFTVCLPLHQPDGSEPDHPASPLPA
jgi:signal transduction histidine kinase